MHSKKMLFAFRRTLPAGDRCTLECATYIIYKLIRCQLRIFCLSDRLPAKIPFSSRKVCCGLRW